MADFDLVRAVLLIPASCSANPFACVSSLAMKEAVNGTDWLLLKDGDVEPPSVKRASLFPGDPDLNPSSSASRRAMASSLTHGSSTGLFGATAAGVTVRTGMDLITRPPSLPMPLFLGVEPAPFDVGFAASSGGSDWVGAVGSCGISGMMSEG